MKKKRRNAMSQFEIAIMSVISLLANQHVASESGRARDQCQSKALTLPVNLSFSFLPRVSRHLYYSIATDS